MSRIDLQIVATGNFAALEGQIARLKAQIASINAMGIAGNPAQLRNVQGYSTAFANALSASGMFQNRMVNLTSETERFGRSLERGNLRLGQYFKAGSEHIRRQRGQIRALAREQVRMSNSVVTRTGDGRGIVSTPRGIDEAIHKQKILNQEHRIFRQVVQGGATQLINWGKNTQWAGRQLTVGLTMPLVIFGAVAGKMFMDADKQLTRMAKVYGDATKGMISDQELESIRGKTLSLAQEISRTMGVAASETIGIAADIAATGREGNELLTSTREAMRLSVLGEVDRQEAMKATLAIQSVFKQDTDGLTESINLLNAVENQTSTTLNDLVTGIIKAGPVVYGLGGSIGDLASMMVAMREGGIPAAEAANAIKSSLASLINPTKQTTDLLSGFGINLREIVDKNAGDVIGTLMDLQGALDGIDQLSRQRAIEQMFGKFQFSRINALLSNLNRAGSQTEQVLKIAGMSATQLAQTAQTELDRLTESASMRFTRAVEGLKSSLIPIGETFIELGSKIINFAETIISAFNDLPDGLKTFIKIIGGITAIAGPIIMITGVFGNFFGYIIKTVGALLALRRGARGVFEFYTAESIAAQSATELLSKGMFNQTEATNVLRGALDTLNAELEQVARNMNMVANASSTAMARQGAATASATAAVSASSAAALAARNGSVIGMLGRGKRSGTSSFSGPEFSHLHPSMNLPTNIRLAQTVGTLINPSIPAQAAARNWQQAMGASFAPTSFYDPSRGSRISQLEQMTYGAGRASASNLAYLNTMRTSGAEGQTAAARLYPSRNEYNAYVAKYWASLEKLEQMGKVQVDRMTKAINREMAKGNTAGAEAILMTALDVNGKQFKRLVDEQTRKVTSVNGTMGEVIAQVGATTAGLEARLRSAGMQGFGKTADNMFRMVSAGAGGGMISDDKLVDKRSQRYADALNKQTQLTSQRNTWIQRLNEREQKLAAAITQHGEKSKQASVALGQVTRAKKKLAVIMDELSNNSKELSAAEKGLLKPKMNELAQSMGLTRQEMDAYRGALMTGRVGQLKQMESAKLLEIAGQKYAFQLNAAGNIINAVNLTTNKLIAKEEAIALYRSKQQAAINEEIFTMKMGFFARRRLNAEMQNLIQQHKETAVSFELVQQANGKYAVAIKNAADKVLATTTSYGMGQGARGQRFAMGAGMAAGMSMMFMPMDGSGGTAAKVGGGALLGASMGSMFGVPGLAMGAALGAAIPILQAYQREQQAVNDRLIAYGEALNGSSLVLDKFASEVGKLKPSEKLTAALGNIAMPEQVVGTGKSILDTEAGQQLREMSRNLGGEQLRTALSNQLKQLTLMEIFTPAEAKAVAQTLAIELGNPELGRSLVQGINSILDSEGNIIKDNISSLFMSTIPDIDIPIFGKDQVHAYNETKSFFDNAMQMVTGNLGEEIIGGFIPGYVTTAEETEAAKRFAQENIGSMASSLDKLREAQSLVINDFMSGNITFEEYSKRMQDIREQNIKAADSIMSLKKSGAPIGAMLKDIADKAGRGDEYKQIEEVARNMFETLGVGERLLTQVQLAAAYGDVTLGEVQNLADLITDEDTRRNLEIVFNVRGAEDNATEIIKLLGMGLDAEFIKTISIDSVEIGKPLSDIYASLSAISKLPPTVQKSVIADIQSDPFKMQGFISDFEYVQSLPDTKKGLYAEIQGNEDLVELRDNWDQFIALPKEERKTAILTTIITGTYDFGGPPEIPSPVAPGEIAMPDVSSMIPSSSGGGGGGSSDDSAIDKKIKQQDKIIKQIQKEREERQRLLDLEKQTLEFALKKQGLENQIARAKAEGRLADAALLQAQLDIENKASSDEEAERRRQEAEDKRIARAEKRKKELEKQKEKSSGGGGGGGGGADEEAARKIEQRLAFLNDELQAALQGNVKILDNINDIGADAFWDYGPIQRYIKEAVKAGIPIKTVRAELEKIFDFMVGEGFKDVPIYKQIADDLNDVGVAGESLNKVLPNVFAILQDPKLDAEEALKAVIKQFKSIGMTSEEARKRAEKFFNMKSSTASSMYENLDKFNDKFDEIKNRFSDNNGKLIITEFTKGIRDGLSRSQILDNISKAIYDATYTNGIAEGMEEGQAMRKAESMSNSVKGIINTEFDGYFKEVEIKGKWDGIVNGQEVPPALRGMFNKDGKWTGNEQAATAAIEATVKLEPSTTPTSVTNSSSNPLWVRGTVVVSGGSSDVPPHERAFGGIIRGPGGPMSDIIPAMLSNGEYVIRASSVDKFGVDFFDLLNKGVLPEFGRGGSSKYPSMVRNMGMGGPVYYNKGGLVNENSSSTEYNIEVNVSSTNASPDDIAKEVIRAIERKQRMKGSSITI